MKNLNKRTEFERQWEDVFREAEKAPPEEIWHKVDSALSKEEAGYFKKRAFVFKLLAAASIAFALGVGFFSISNYLNQAGDELVQQTGEIESPLASADETGEAASIQEESVAALSSTDDSATDTAEENARLPEEGDGNLEVAAIEQFDSNNITNADARMPLAVAPDQARESTIHREFYAHNELAPMGLQRGDDADELYVIDHMYLIPVMPRDAFAKKKEPQKLEFLAGLDFSTGIFDPNFQQSGAGLASSPNAMFSGSRAESINDRLTSFNTTNKDFLLVRSAGQETEPQVSFSYGANFGMRLSRRIYVQTGLAYSKANTTTTTTGYLEQGGGDMRIPIVASYRYELDGLSSVNRIQETSLNNQYEFASIPIKAGYIFLDRKFNITVLAGLSSEFFLSNNISDNTNYLEDLSSSAGQSSPYKNVYFNGTLGTMLGYSFSGNYLISVEPSYRFAVNSFTRNEFYLNSYPSSFMVSFGVSYNFK